METMSVQIFNELLLHHDRSLQLFDALMNPPVAKQVISSALKPASLKSAQAALVPSSLIAPLVRVRADILDRLVNQAGEVSISRSRLESEVGNLRLSLVELSDNIQRLRKQLREVEIQTESHIGTQINGPHAQHFDPLEFDRYTRLHELTRMMAESVDDVGTVQQTILGSLSNAAIDLATQSRMTRDLQQDLMRVRMVQFGSLSDRLYRLVRETSKEEGKRVNLDIRGTGLEVDRSVLDRMAGPFEHLLRNAIVHGIENTAARQAAKKSETGELVIEVRQDGNEVVLQFSDDGRGLDLSAIRRRARKQGLLTEASAITDADLIEMIFHPGFTTLDTVSEVAGRGIGMDVVRSEASALGGTVSIQSIAGQGAKVMIRLPLTLAVTQIVLLVNGGITSSRSCK
jgi:chemosensory pili system protein ChpA (sensor histidine kinase/response regulator)